MDHFAFINGRLHAEGVALDDIAGSVGTPTYVYSSQTLRDHVTRLRDAFSALDPLICFSVKACSNTHVLRTLTDLGIGLDVVSGGELKRASLAGCPSDRIVFAGVGKTDDELRAALAAGPLASINVESASEFERLAALAGEAGVVPDAALRINPDIDPGTHAHTTTGTGDTKFGVNANDAPAFFEAHASDPRARLNGLHVHLGSPIFTTEPFVRAVDRVLELVDHLDAAGHHITTIDLGGGFGADYLSDATPSYREYAQAILPRLEPRVRDGLRIILEPGRTICANAGVLLVRVVHTKPGKHADGRDKVFAICDAGMNALVRPSHYDAYHFAWPAVVSEATTPPLRGNVDLPGLVSTDIVGPICETGDFLARDRMLPPVQRGDLIAVFTAGAYGMTMANTYNSHPLPAEVLVDGGSARVVRMREPVERLLEAEGESSPISLG